MPYRPSLFIRAAAAALALGAVGASAASAQAPGPPAASGTLRATVRITPALDATRLTADPPSASSLALVARVEPGRAPVNARRSFAPPAVRPMPSDVVDQGASGVPLVRWWELWSDRPGPYIRQWVAIAY